MCKGAHMGMASGWEIPLWYAGDDNNKKTHINISLEQNNMSLDNI